MVLLSTVEELLQSRRIAVIGAVNDPRSFSRTVLAALADHGYDVVPVSSAGGEVDGRPVARSMAEVADADAAVVMVGGERAVDAVEDCARAGVERIWLFKGIGGEGAAVPAAVERCRHHGMAVVDGACPLMFLEPVGFAHRVHRAVRRRRGALVRVPG